MSLDEWTHEVEQGLRNLGYEGKINTIADNIISCHQEGYSTQEAIEEIAELLGL